jgi:DNA-binding CsgD family transcriptional regulator
VRDHDRAFAWCDRIAEFADRYGSRYMLAFCRSEYGLVQVWRGRWNEAATLLEASFADFADSRPAWVGGPLTQLAELRRRQGRPAEAERLLDRAGTSRAAQLCRARLALDAGDTRRASDLAVRALRGVPLERRLERVAGLELLVRAQITRGELDEADEACAELAHTASVVGTTALWASADLAAGMLAAARGEHERARPLLEDAVDRFDACGAPFESAQARRELAVTLGALGLKEAAAREARVSVEGFTRLGARPDAERSRRAQGSVVDPGRPAVTRREEDVLRLLAQGKTNRQIAEQLVVSEHTVHRHVTNILRKLDLPSRTAAAAVAVRSGLADD